MASRSATSVNTRHVPMSRTVVNPAPSVVRAFLAPSNAICAALRWSGASGSAVISSIRWVWRSISPGTTVYPVRSMTVAPAGIGPWSGPTAVIHSPVMTIRWRGRIRPGLDVGKPARPDHSGLGLYRPRADAEQRGGHRQPDRSRHCGRHSASLRVPRRGIACRPSPNLLTSANRKVRVRLFEIIGHLQWVTWTAGVTLSGLSIHFSANVYRLPVISIHVKTLVSQIDHPDRFSGIHRSQPVRHPTGAEAVGIGIAPTR